MKTLFVCMLFLVFCLCVFLIQNCLEQPVVDNDNIRIKCFSGDYIWIDGSSYDIYGLDSSMIHIYNKDGKLIGNCEGNWIIEE